MILKNALLLFGLTISTEVVKLASPQGYNGGVEVIIGDLVGCEYEENGREVVDCIVDLLGGLNDEGLEYEELVDEFCEFFNGGSTELGDCFAVCDGFDEVNCNDGLFGGTQFGGIAVDKCGIESVEACENFFGINSSQKTMKFSEFMSTMTLITALATQIK